jgi:hypothetical protein
VRNITFAFAVVGTLMAGQLQAACIKPTSPTCAIQTGTFAGETDYDGCRKQMLAYKREMEAYSSCANDAGQAKERQIAEEELKATLAQFNRRARGE